VLNLVELHRILHGNHVELGVHHEILQDPTNDRVHDGCKVRGTGAHRHDVHMGHLQRQTCRGGGDGGVAVGEMRRGGQTLKLKSTNGSFKNARERAPNGTT
jgi:hypothetical protein